MMEDSTNLRAGPEETRERAQGALWAFLAELPRLNKLKRYSEGQHEVLRRLRRPGLPNLRLAHGFPRYIAQVSAGYLMGEEVCYRDEAHPEGVKALERFYAKSAQDSVDMELALQQSIYGRALSLNADDGKGGMRVYALSPLEAFPVYDDWGEIAMGMRVQRRGKGMEVTLYTREEWLVYEADAEGRLGPLKSRRPHGLKEVPLVEYRNGPSARGDFEDVLPLIDAYDLMQSDRFNDRAQFSDALLVLTGVMGISAEGEGENPMELLRRERTLALPDSDSKAEWLVKSPMEKDLEVLRSSLSEDIHKFSMTPDFSDERFSGNASGVAIKFKLFNLDQRIRVKERWFIEGLKRRARLVCNHLKARGEAGFDPDSLQIRLKRRLPVNELEQAQTLSLLKGLEDPKSAERPEL